MKIAFLLLFLLTLSGTASAQQPDSGEVKIDTVRLPVFKSNAPFALNVLVGDNQRYDQMTDPTVLITPPTMIVEKHVDNGSSFVVLYANTDHINIICKGITRANKQDYEAYRRVILPRTIISDSIFDSKLRFGFPEIGPRYLKDDDLNTLKFRFPQASYYYYIKNRNGHVVATLTVDFELIPPEPVFASVNDTLIDRFINHPGSPNYFRRNRWPHIEKNCRL